MAGNERRTGEFALIAELFAPLVQGEPGAFGLRDDAAVLSPPEGYELVLTTDAIVESVDFFREDPPETVARKALRVNLSDLAAKGAEPAAFLLTLLLPEWTDMAWLRAFASSLAAEQAEFGVSLMGGDTSATPGPLVISITAFGLVPKGAMIRRAGAKPGDLVFVSGTIGDSGGGLAVLQGEAPWDAHHELVARYRSPLPRLALGPALRGIAGAALDVSDGLIADLEHLSDASGVRIEIDAARVPLSAALRALWGGGDDAVRRAVTAGDDYEIAFTAPPEKRSAVTEISARTRVPVAEIGRVTAGQGVALLDAAGKEIVLSRKGFRHF